MKKLLALALSAVMAISMVACGGETVETHNLQIGRVQGAAHGTKCFASITAVVEGDKVVAAFIDEYQYGAADSMAGVPNATELAANFAEGKVVYSKRVNNAAYSANMANAGSTVELAANYDAIQAHVAGKTIAELETLVAGEAEAVVDAVAGCTLVDTKGYITVIVEAAKAAQANTAVTFEGSLEGAALKTVLGAAHGTKCWAEISAFVVGDKVVCAYIDEYQFGAADSMTGVPNSAELAANLAEGKVLYSKRVNNAAYSANMANAGSTVELAANYDAIQAHVAGKTVAELEALATGDAQAAIDAVAGCTLADTAGYIGVIVEAAKA